MAKDKKLVEAITSMDEDFAQWYTDVVKKAELCDYSSVKGCMVIKPDGYALWDSKAGDYDSMDGTPKRDFVKELADECRKAGIGLFIYYSYGLDWHHPFFMSDIQEAENYSNLPLKERLRYDSLFQASNVSCYVAGHLHDNADARHGDVQYITTSALGRQLGKAQAGVRILRIDSEGVSQCYVAVPDLPSTSEALEQLFNSQFNN